MISPRQIARLVELEEYRHLVERVLTNGRCRSRMAQCVLNRPEVAVPAAIGLALQRLAEITYGPSELASALARKLVQMQRHDGLFGNGQKPSNESLIAATSTALRGLLTWLSQHRAAGMTINRPILQAIENGMTALVGLFKSEICIQGSAAGWAIAVWQLGDEPTFRRAIPISDLLALLEDSSADLVEDDLCRYAHAMAA